MSRTPHPSNVPGDYYVEDGCCTMCTLPFYEAPDLIGEVKDPRGYTHCFVKCQPRSDVETTQMISAIRVAELSCIRYRGTDARILKRLTDLGEAEVCDEVFASDPGNAPDPLAVRMKTDEHEQRRYPSTARVVLLLCLAGAYLLMGAVYSFFSGNWFPGFPPVLDVASLLSGSGRTGVYVEAGVVAALGGACLVVAIRILVRARFKPSSGSP